MKLTAAKPISKTALAESTLKANERETSSLSRLPGDANPSALDGNSNARSPAIIHQASWQTDESEPTQTPTLGPALDGSEANKKTTRRIDVEDRLSNSDDVKESNSTTPNDAGDAQPESPPLASENFPDASCAGLTLENVLNSVVECYPEIEVAVGQIEAAQGKVLSSWGQFDSVFSAHTISQPLGFYQTYRNGAGISRPLYGGGEVYGAYRIGDGNFEPWYGERETNEAGEFKTGFSLPLLKDRNIDARRAKLLAAGANRDQVSANVETRLLQFQRFATQAYWDWVASGQAVQIQRQLLQLAETRADQITKRVELGDLAMIAEIDNQRFIAKRNNDLIKARRSLEKTAIKLSLFFRDTNCAPIIADTNLLPNRFPVNDPISNAQRDLDISKAISVRPELLELNAARREVTIDCQYAANLTLPKLDLKGFAGQDLGGKTSSKGDKTPFELQLGVYAEVPLQRREGLGKLKTAKAKLNQLDAKCRFVSDKIRAELQDAASAVNAAYNQIQQSQLNVRLNMQSLKLGRMSFEAGDIDLIALNIYETSVASAKLELLEAQFKYFYYLAAYETAKTGTAFQ